MTVPTVEEPALLALEGANSAGTSVVASDYGAGIVLSVTLLGPMHARDADGNDVLPPLRRTRALLAILALASPRPVLRSHLMDLLWHQRASLKAAHGSLRQALYELRTALGAAAELLHVRREHIALSGAGLHVDALQPLLETAAYANQPAPSGGGLLPELEGLNPAFDRWLYDRRDDLARRVHSDGEAVLAKAGEPAVAAAAAARLLAIDAAHEGAWRTLIRSHIARGDRAAALAAYEQCRIALLESYQMSPSSETTGLVANLHSVAAARESRSASRGRLRLEVASLRSSAGEGVVELAAALTEELVDALSRFRWLGCTKRTSGQSELGADFLLDGSVQRSDDRLRVSLSLTNLCSGSEVVWADRFDSKITDILAMKGWLAATAAARIEPRLWLWTAERVSTPRTAQDLLRLAVPTLLRMDRNSFMRAGRLLNQSIELDRDDASAHAWASRWHMLYVGQGWATDASAATQRAHELAERAVMLDREDALGLTLSGHVNAFLRRRPDEALRLHEQAIAANPNLPLSWSLSGLAHSYIGQSAEGVRRIRHAQALSPSDPLNFFNESALAVCHLVSGDYEEAVAAGERAIALNASFSSTHKAYLTAMGHLGREDAAASVRASLLELEPGFSVAEALRRSPFATREARMLYVEGLRAAGFH